MNIQKITTLRNAFNYQSPNPHSNNNQFTTPTVQSSYDKVDYSKIPFGAIHNVQPPKKLMDVEQEKTKLLRQLDEILQSQPENCSKEEQLFRRIHTSISFLRTKAERLKKLNERLEALSNDTMINQQQTINQLFEIRKEFRQLEKSKIPPPPKPKVVNEKIDYKLINRFKTAVIQDNFRLDKVYRNYYQDLENIKTIKELNKKYPKIKVPPRPEEVIAQKVLSTLTRDFYEDFAQECKKSAEDGFKFSDNKIQTILDETAKKYNFNADVLYAKAAATIHFAIIDKYKNAKLKGFSSLHEHRKVTTPPITDTDLRLLALNYDDVVLSTLRQQYLENKKPNEIVYTYKNTAIPIKALNQTEYKFEKVPEKPLGFIRSAEKIRQGQRSYNLFDHDMLHKRIGYFANTELSNNEELFEHLIKFNECSPHDRENLINFLQVLDEINDGNQTIEAGLETIEKKGIHPIETEKLNEAERQEEIRIKRLEQQKINQLNNIQSEFDEIIDTLYLNDMNNIAILCSKYRPKTLEEKSLEDANFLMNLISDNTNEFSEINKPKVESFVTNWDNYKYYENNDPQNPIFIKAKEIATDENGKLDITRAGQFITNSEVVQAYPECLEFVPNPDLLKRIIEKKSSNTEAVLALCKFSDYSLLDPKDKASILKLSEMFDIKNAMDKLMLKYIVENDYSNTDTTAILPINENETIETTMSAQAKQAIIEKYKFPNCLEYLEAFENALSKMASARGSAGIKLTGRNNEANPYKMELKISGHDDRLFSSENNYYFDIYSERGLHSKKA